MRKVTSIELAAMTTLIRSTEVMFDFFDATWIDSRNIRKMLAESATI
jgi:hypothetical protein